MKRRHPPCLLAMALLLPSCLGWLTGCGGRPGPEVVVYAAQDRLFAEPIFREFQRATGIEVRAVYDNEATKTTGLANRLLVEQARPQADLWWSNEELRTRQLTRLGVLEPDTIAFGERRRVLVCASNRVGSLPVPFSLSTLTNAPYRGQVAMAYPLFGTTATHLLVLRQRWGEAAWQSWCRDLHANRPLLLDGNSLVVRRVAAGDAWIGLTDTDDVIAAQREGEPVAAIALPVGEDLRIPNTVAVVQGARHPDAARRLANFLQSPGVIERLVRDGAFEAGNTAPGAAVPAPIEWDRVINDLDLGTRWLGETFRRGG